MAVELATEALDLAIVTREHDAMLAFYADILGLPVSRVGQTSVGEIHYLRAGTSVLKLIRPSAVPEAGRSPGDLTDATGLRYFTLRVSNLDEVLADCERLEVPIVRAKDPLPARPGWVAMVADPDGNPVALVQHE